METMKDFERELSKQKRWKAWKLRNTVQMRVLEPVWGICLRI